MGKGVRKATPGSAVSVVGLLGPSGGLQQRRQHWRHRGAGRALRPGWRSQDTGACAGVNPGGHREPAACHVEPCLQGS